MPTRFSPWPSGQRDPVSRSQKALEFGLFFRNHALRLIANQDARAGACRSQLELSGRAIEGEQGGIDLEQRASVVDYRGDRLLGIGLARHGKTHVVDRAQDGVASLEDLIPLSEVAR
jgi:hypothetical protein